MRGPCGTGSSGPAPTPRSPRTAPLPVVRSHLAYRGESRRSSGQGVQRHSRIDASFCFEEGDLVGGDSVDRPCEHMAVRRLLAAGRNLPHDRAAAPSVDLCHPAVAG
ncbi:oxidoreductase C-terminal domain-containing protein [Pseudonocardia halophobica]